MVDTSKMTSEERLTYVNSINRFTAVNHIFLTELDENHARVEMKVTEDSCNILGAVHGGAIATMADFAAGALTRMDHRAHVTSSLEMKFIGNVTSGNLVAVSEIIHRGGTLTNVRVRVTEEESGKLLSEGMATYFCIGKK